MPPDALAGSLAVFTIGYADMPVQRFLNNLRAYGITVLADVRPPAFLSHVPQFAQESIATQTRSHGLDYLYLGRELCGLPGDPDCYDRHGHVLYDRVAAQPEFDLGIERVVHELRQGRQLALACVEEHPRECHRRRLVGRVLREKGIGLAHILPEGGIISEAELLDEEAAQPRQLTLFGDEPAPRWRSARAFPKPPCSGRT
ncbi:Protein of unknown function, DUF488 [Humidesulfovibrio mexicanus]|jgi:uncharacterized protein (DUF488 family)|uniref:DUF488 domain-containing protein n=1 Tax=Humidesulfovibrio mexicanus TaxID=147047 RepID=A0A238Z2D6_9BACT|nr:DUF488 domain-containing protein [Humidesulfovibrio mexicanus]SNR77004.1 Protein of unknown function, DUF488 [Humidesulfovibrio mexicanus]